VAEDYLVVDFLAAFPAAVVQRFLAYANVRQMARPQVAYLSQFQASQAVRTAQKESFAQTSSISSVAVMAPIPRTFAVVDFPFST